MGASVIVVQMRNSLTGRCVAAPPEPHFAGAPDRIFGGAAWLRGVWFTSVGVCASKSQRLG